MRLNPNNTIIMVIDIQEKLYPVINGREELLSNTIHLLKGAALLKVPVILTEQYPKGLGKTVSEIAELLPDAQAFEKVTFSSLGNEQVLEKLRSEGRNHVILCGMETHICVLQTVLDLNEQGFRTILLDDCVGSRHKRDKKAAMNRAEREGAYISTSEAVLFELLGSATNPQFKEISRLIK